MKRLVALVLVALTLLVSGCQSDPSVKLGKEIKIMVEDILKDPYDDRNMDSLGMEEDLVALWDKLEAAFENLDADTYDYFANVIMAIQEKVLLNEALFMREAVAPAAIASAKAGNFDSKELEELRSYNRLSETCAENFEMYFTKAMEAERSLELGDIMTKYYRDEYEEYFNKLFNALRDGELVRR